MTVAPVLRAEGITVRVPLPGGGSLTAVDSVSFQVEAGDAVAIVGRSGSGKTSLLSVVALLTTAYTGALWHAGKDVSTWPDAARSRWRAQHVGVVFQSFSLIQHLTARDNVALAARYGLGLRPGAAARTALDALGAVGLADRWAALPRHLSGGEQQRVAVARALVNEPSVILADEPTGSLDVDTGDAVMQQLLQRVREQSCALILVTHDADRAAQCGRVLRMERGAVQEESPAS